MISTRIGAWGSVLISAIGIVVACSSDTPLHALAEGCILTSDCSAPLVCMFGKCHSACNDTRDCTPPGRCVRVAGATQAGVCQSSDEVAASCTSSAQCADPLKCAVDSKCHAACGSPAECLPQQVCVSHVCADKDQLELSTGDLPHTNPAGGWNGVGDGDGGPAEGGSLSADASSDAGTGSSGNDGGDAASVVNACPSAQTQFGDVATGDSNAHFTSSVGVRTANQLLIFSAYSGPAAGIDDGGIVNLVYLQAFDPVTGKAAGPAASLFRAEDGGAFTVDDVSVAPTGQIALIHSSSQTNSFPTDRFVSFLSVNTDAGAASVQLQKTVQVETNVQFSGSPHAIWSGASNTFVFSWAYYATGVWSIKVRKFLPSGQGAGSDTNAAPARFYQLFDQASVGVSGDLLAVGWAQNLGGCPHIPFLTVLDSEGNQFGDFIELPYPGCGVDTWVTAGGTAAGFVSFFQTGPTVYETFVPRLGDGGVMGSDVDAGDAGALRGFTFASAAVTARTISDGAGGGGGVGTVLLEANGVSFIYVKADGIGHVGPTSVFSHTRADGDQVAITSSGGSFGVSLYSTMSHSTQMAASGCAK